MELSNTKFFTTEKVMLSRSEDHEAMEFVFRPYKRGDDEQIIELIRSEYGDSYGRKEIYEPGFLAKANEECREIFLLILHEEAVIGMVVMFVDKDSDTIELGAQILKREFRGFGLAKRFLDYVYPMTASLRPQAITADVVAFHGSTSTMCEEEGMVATGFLPGYLSADKYNPKYAVPQIERQSLTYYILPVEKKDAGIIYVPEQIEDFVVERYEKLGVTYTLMKSSQDTCSKEKSSFSITEDAVYDYRFITVDNCGEDLVEKIQETMNKGSDRNWIYSLKLPLDSPGIVSCFSELIEAGFHLSGMLPLVGNRDYLLMYYARDYKLGLEYLKLTEDAKTIRDYIISC